MVKFEEDTDSDYQIVSSKIVFMSRAAQRDAKDTINLSIDSFRLPIDLPSGRNHNFTGREDILRQIHEKFTESCENNGKIVALHGTGGLGKTQIALEYAYSQSSRYSTIVWIDGQSLSTTTSSVIAFVQRLLDHYTNTSSYSTPDYLETARNLHVGGMVDRSGRLDCQRQLYRVIEAAKHWLQQKRNDNWLMICDNVDDLESFNISDYWPNSPNRKVLITSRRPESIRFDDGVALPQMQLNESFTLFARSLGREMKTMGPTEVEESKRIVEKLGFLPLAIDQAGAYIQRLSMPLHSYLPLFDRNFRQVMDKKPPKALWHYREDTVLTTWEVSYGAVINQCPEAAEILTISSFFSNQNIPENLLEHCVQVSDCAGKCSTLGFRLLKS
ncbi:MAG: hypothetical protein Q9214_000671 [Letrouitia sp. 1 TL-2023]